MPKHSAINEYKWAVIAMLNNADLPRVGKPDRLLLRATTLDNGEIALHINIPWLLAGDDKCSGNWGWEAISFSCRGQELTRYGYVNPVPTTDIINVANPDSNERLLTLVKDGIERAYSRQLAYMNRGSRPQRRNNGP